MMTFADLKFEESQEGLRKHAVLMFDNGYGISVAQHRMETGYDDILGRGYYTYTNNDYQWEIAVLERTGEKSYKLCYTTTITDDVMGWQEEEDVNEVMKNIQSLAPIN